MTLAEHDRRWRAVAQAEIDRIGSDLPAALVLAVWWRESRGVPGIRNLDGGAASGLGQLLPIAVDFYNQNHATSYTIADLRGTDERSIAIQVQTSIWLLRWNLSRAVQWLPDTDPRDQYLVALLSYAQGWRAVRERLNGLRRKGIPLSWSSLRACYPDGWQGKAGALDYADGTFDVFERLFGLPEPAELRELPAPVQELRPLIPTVGGVLIAGLVCSIVGLIIVLIALRGSK